MKETVKIMAVCLLAVSACRNASKTNQDFIPGTYVKSNKSTYGIAEDTVFITRTGGKNYLVDFHVTYQAIRDGRRLPPRHKDDQLSALWDASKEQLTETVTGRTYTFQPDKQRMMLNAGVFRKIK